MKKLFLVVLFAVGAMSLSNEAKADDPRIGRIISALEAITYRLDRMESGGHGGHSGASYQPVAYQQQQYAPQYSQSQYSQYCPTCQQPMRGVQPQYQTVGYGGGGGGRVYYLIGN